MTTEDQNDDQHGSRRERMRAFLKPISHERAQELLDRQTEQVKSTVEQPAKQRRDGLEDESAPDSSK